MRVPTSLWRFRRRPKTEADALARIREHQAALGAPVDHLTDDQLRANIARLGRLMKASQGSVAAFAKNQKALAEFARSATRTPPRSEDRA